MSRTIRNTIMTLALSVAAMAAIPGQAKADDYCREYTRTVNIGGRTQDAYGTACRQSDGSWMIVGEGLGNDIPNNVNDVDYVIHDNRQDIVPTRVVYYDSSPRYYRRPVAPVFVWSVNGFFRGGNYYPYHRYNYYDTHRGWNNNHGWGDHDRDDHRGNGHGHH